MNAPSSLSLHASQRSDRYEPAQIESFWQAKWQKAQLFAVADPTHDQLSSKYYVLEMLPYPSGRIHMGHVRNYSIGDVLARFHRMRGRHVLHPMGWDSFGMPAENAAIERGRHPADWTLENIATMKSQLSPLGLTYDWSREVSTCDPDYYRWEQLIFTRMLKEGLAYQKNAVANWCPTCATVLANEQVEDGKCWRCSSEVVQRELRQWFLKITEYAEELLEGLDSLKGGWPDQVLTMQRNWIGKSQGAKVRFAIAEEDRARAGVDGIEIFTTRPDTLFGVTFMSVAPEHPVAKACAADSPKVAAFLEKMSRQSDLDRTGEGAEKEGVALGVHVVHPLTGKKIHVFAASFVLMGYGTGAVMAVPAHDTRDFAFAKKHGLPLKVVIQPNGLPALDPDGVDLTDAFTESGTMVGSGDFDGLPSEDAKAKIAAVLKNKGLGEETTTYRLRDWLVSRQRYWGCPIPVIHCEDGAVVPVPEHELPVLLPRDVQITGEGGSPLVRHPTFSKTFDPRDPSKAARRETDTFDTFWESSWYFLRYTSKSDKAPFDPAVAGAWMPVDQYIGGVEHAVMHLLYARFLHKVLIDLGLLPRSTAREPFRRLLAQGMVCMQTAFVKDDKGSNVWLYPEEIDEEGRSRASGTSGKPVERGRIEKMSKSKKNVVDPVPMVARYGADTVRLFMLFASPPESELIWSDSGIEGAYRFLGRVYRAVRDIAPLRARARHVQERSLEATELRRKLHQTVIKVTHDIEHRNQFNTAISAMMELVNAMVPLTAKAGSEPDRGALYDTLVEAAETLSQLLSPFAPHLADELWNILGNEGFLLARRWPVADEDAAREDEVEIGVQINGKARGRIRIAKDADEASALSAARAEASLTQYLDGKTPKKIVYVAGRILNLIV
ncbi:MAG: leucine--tRNA ligase [Polyangiales bacterium]